MVKAVIQYSDYLGDKITIKKYLGIKSIRIMKERKWSSIYPKLTIAVESEDLLNKILVDLNQSTNYGVTLLKVENYDPHAKMKLTKYILLAITIPAYILCLLCSINAFCTGRGILGFLWGFNATLNFFTIYMDLHEFTIYKMSQNEKSKVSSPKMSELLECAAEEIENLYGRETDLTREIREFLG